MSNENNKQKLNIWLEKSLVAQIDGACARDDCSRATVIKNALNSYFKNESSNDLQLTAINARFDALEAREQTRTTLILDAIKNQPVQIQPQNLLEFEESKQKKSFLKRLISR